MVIDLDQPYLVTGGGSMGLPFSSTSISTGTLIVRPSEVVSVRQVRMTRRSLVKVFFVAAATPSPTPTTPPTTLLPTVPTAVPTALPTAGPGELGLVIRASRPAVVQPVNRTTGATMAKRQDAKRVFTVE